MDVGYEEKVRELESTKIRFEQRLTALEGLVNYHQKILVVGNGSPALPEQIRTLGAQVEGVKDDVKEVGDKVTQLVDNMEKKQDTSNARWWQIGVIVITIFLSNILAPLITKMFMP